MGRLTHKGLCYSFEILHGHKNMKTPMKKKKFQGPPTPPPSPPNNPILGGQKPKWAISPRRVCGTGMKGRRGLQVTKIIVIQGN
jgi:hypothetical protein